MKQKRQQFGSKNWIPLNVSAMGIGIFALGVGAILAPYISRFSVLFIIVGLLAHSWGMYKMHKTQGKTQKALGMQIAYWICWVALIAVLTYMLLKLFT